MSDSGTGRAMRQVKWLSQALIISAAFNIGLLATFFYLLLRQTPLSNDFLHRPKAALKEVSLTDESSNTKVLTQLESLTFDQLIGKLDNTESVEDGYRMRDLSLACLVCRYQFHLEKALGGQPLQQRILTWKKEDGQLAEVTVFPGLSEENFRTIVHFASTERWPLTSRGLFVQLKRGDIFQQKTLLEAFYFTPEFLAVETLFSRTGLNINRQRLISFLREGDFATLSLFAESQKTQPDFSQERRQRFLWDYVVKKSKSAAYLLLHTDGPSIAKKSCDEQIVSLLALLSDQTQEVEQFAIELLASPRSDAVWKAAAGRLYAFHAEALPEPYDHRLAMVRFVPKSVLQEKIAMATKQEVVAIKTKPQSVKKVSSIRHIDRIYVVQDGDNLWKIAHKYNIGIDKLRIYNQLSNDQLKVGQVLKIPVE